MCSKNLLLVPLIALNMKFLILALATLAYAQRPREFSNPVLTEKYFQSPSGIKVNETYFLFAKSGDINGIFDIYSSIDLDSWKTEGFVFTNTSVPTWAKYSTFDAIKVHKIGVNYLAYFSVGDVIGVAIASHPRGPYTATHRPILSLPNDKLRYPTIMNDAGTLYLLWTHACSTTCQIFARRLSSNGLSFSSAQAITILKEEQPIHFPMHLRKDDYHYLIYSLGSDCNNYTLTSSRSSFALGPYEKGPAQDLTDMYYYNCVSVSHRIEDINNGYIFIGSGYDKVYESTKLNVILAQQSWDENGTWPEIEQIK